MRQALVNENADLVSQNHKYIMRITGDNNEGKNELDQFIHPEEKYPVIVTTSELMTTGVDAQTCKLIVLDKSIQSMTKFKQIIGRGTRINEDFGKLYFTIMDFKKATELFADKKFDGDPVVVYEPKPGEPIVPPDDLGGKESPDGSDSLDGVDDFGDRGEGSGTDDGDATIPQPLPGGGKRTKYYVNDVPVKVMSERVQYYGNDGKLITESLKGLHSQSDSKQVPLARRVSATLVDRRAEASRVDGIGRPWCILRRVGPTSRQGPRSIRLGLPRRIRPTATHAS